MPAAQDHSHLPVGTRRQFIKQTGLMAAAVAGANLLPIQVHSAEMARRVAIVLDHADSVMTALPVSWSIGQLIDALRFRGLAVQIYPSLDDVPAASECVYVAGPASRVARHILERVELSLPEVPEALALARGKSGRHLVTLAVGSDVRGLVYAVLELADRVKFAADPLEALQGVKPVIERPANAIRSLSRGFTSDVEDKGWFNDREFWTQYLTMLATNRFNRFNLALGIGYDFATGLRDTYFYFAYPFLLSVPGYDVRAVPLPDAERDSNLAMLRFISEEAARRGLHFQLGLWTHAYQWTKSPDVNYTITGLTPETQAPYCRDALRALLVACPAINGVTFRVHGESGVPEGSYDLWQTIFEGVVQCGRQVEIDMHAKGMDQPMIDVAIGTGLPVNISPKFWAEHMGLPYMQGAIRPQEMPRNAGGGGFFSRSSGARSFLRYGYGDLFAESRRHGVLHRIWPGTQRLLLWGDPEMAAAYGRVSSFCGSQGVEIFEPLFFKGRKGSGLPGGRDGYADDSLRTRFDFEKYEYSCRVWGRNLYNPEGGADGWQRFLRHEFGRSATDVEGALAAASRILPLVTTAHCPSAANNNYWPEMYFNQSMVDVGQKHPYSDTPSPKLFGNVSPLDPEFFLGVDEFADELLKNEFSGKYSPVWVAGQLSHAAGQAAARLRRAKAGMRNSSSAGFRRLAADVLIQSGLGKFYAAKFQAGVLYALHVRSAHPGPLKAAVAANRAARTAWGELAEVAKSAYRQDISFGPDYFQRGHWLDRLPAMDAEISDLEKLLLAVSDAGATSLKVDQKRIESAMQLVLAPPAGEDPPAVVGVHLPPLTFLRGQPLEVIARIPPAATAGVCLRYRHVNQAEAWQTMEMENTAAGYCAIIMADYTDSPFPLQYHFQIRQQSGSVWLSPGLKPGWLGQPYFVVRQG